MPSAIAQEVPNPGNKMCRLCRGLITEPRCMSSATVWWHTRCHSKGRTRKSPNIKQPSRRPPISSSIVKENIDSR